MGLSPCETHHGRRRIEGRLMGIAALDPSYEIPALSSVIWMMSKWGKMTPCAAAIS
jgi:hypothetical protein